MGGGRGDGRGLEEWKERGEGGREKVRERMGKEGRREKRRERVRHKLEREWRKREIR